MSFVITIIACVLILSLGLGKAIMVFAVLAIPMGIVFALAGALFAPKQSSKKW